MYSRPRIFLSLISLTLIICVVVISFVFRIASAQSPTDFSFPGTTSSPTVKSQMWINDGTWWGIFSDGSAGLYFYQKVGNSFIKGNLADSNVLGQPDTLWDGTNLFVLILENQAEAKLYKYSYTMSPQEYVLAAGFPVTMPLTGLAVSAVVAKDSTEKLWVTYAGSETGAGGDSSIHVIWSTSADHLTWDTTGFVLETGTASNAAEVAGIVSFNDGSPKIGVVWSNQALGEYGFRYHTDGALETGWNPKEIVDSNGIGGGIASEYVSIQAAPDGRVFVVGKDLIGAGHANLYVRSTSATWSARVPVNTDVTSQPSRPILLLDTESNFAYCLYRDSTYNKSTFFARTNLNNPTSFEAPHVFISTKANDATSTKQYVNNVTDLIAAASQNGEIFWNILDLSAPPTASFQANPTSGDAALIVTFTDTSTDDAGIVSWTWNFGDGYTSNEANPTHVFRAGTWNVSLQVMDTTGNTSIANQSIGAADVGNPVIQAITPAVLNSNTISGDFTLTVNGGGFVSGAVVQFNGSDRTTTFVSATSLTATITFADVATAGVFPITVALPNFAVSNAMSMTVTGDNPAPTISTLSPTTTLAGSPAFDLTVNGTGYVVASQIWVNGTERLTTYISPTQLTTNISADLAAALFQIPVWVVNPAPGGATSNTAYFDITPVCSAPAPPISFQGITEFNTVHSQLWHNDGTWWAAISDTTTGLYFWSYANAQVVKGAQIGPNSLAGPDTLWNGTDLFILTYETSSQAKFYKYAYDSLSKTYTLHTGFPVNIPLTGLASSLTFTQDSSGKLWATYTGTNNQDGVGDGRVHVIWTTSPDHLTWDTTGVVLETGLSVLLTETSAITPFGGSNIAVTWSNQASNEVGFRYHFDGDLETTWSVKEVVDSGISHASEYMNLRGLPDGRVFLAQGDNLGNRHVNLFRRNALGTWDPKIPVTRNPISKPKSPLVLFDETNSEIYVLYRDSGNSSFLYAAHMNIDSNVMPAGCPIGALGVSDPTATKQAINGIRDLAVAAQGSGGEVLAIFDLPSPPSPTILSISPAIKTAGDLDFILTVDGMNFKFDSVVLRDGIFRETTFVSSTQLTAQISTADLAVGGLYAITVATPGEPDSNPVNLSVDNLAPTLTSIFPVSLLVGGPAFDLTAIGTNFNNGTILRFNGVDHAVTFFSSTEVHAQIAAAEILNSGVFAVEIFNPTPGGGISFALNFTAESTTPTLTALTPSTTTAGGTAFTLTVDGANFNANSVVLWNGSNRVTTFVSSTRLTAQITAADIQNGGTFPVAVSNPGLSGATSSVLNFIVNNPLPQITAITPTNSVAGGPSFTLTINGTGFVPGAVVRFNGVLPANERTTLFVSSTQLTAGINAADIAAAGTFPITVFNPIPGGGLSIAVSLTVSNPAPAITSISPTSATPGAGAFTLTVSGSNFNTSSAVRINGVDRATTFVSSTQLGTQISAAEVATPATISVAVFNPAPGGGTSSPVQLLVNNPLPAVLSISPTSKAAGDAAFALTLNGTNFISSSVVRFNNSDRATTYVSGSQLLAQITGADIAAAGTASISVFNPAPGGGTSTPTTFTINNSIPVIGGISPASATASGGAFTLTVNGLGFVSGSMVRFNNSDRLTTFVNSTQLTAQITAPDIASAGTASIVVFNPAPGGGASSVVNLSVNNPVPTLSSISPTSKTAGNAAFTLTVNGANFNSSSIVRFNGNDRPTTLLSSSQLNVQISAADLSSGGLYPVTVFNPNPGGGTSSAISLTVNNPVPTIANISPSTILQGSPAILLTVNGTGFVNSSVVAWNGQNRSTTFISSTQLNAQITAADLNAAATASVTVNNPAPGGGISNLTGFTIIPNPRLMSVVSTSGSSGGNASLTIQLIAQGNENALGFSLNYDTALLSNPTATLGADSAGATVNVNAAQVGQGRYGVAFSLPSGMSFTAGTRQVVVVTFTVAANVASGTQTQIGFGDQPVAREVANPTAEVLPTAFIPGTLTISAGLEGDVAPRPNGSNNGTVSIADWVQTGRFAAGVDVGNLGSEFQRADCAPRSSFGNGQITVSDWVQAGRYSAGLDPVALAGGPSGPSTAPSATEVSDKLQSNAVEESSKTVSRVVRLTDALQQAGEERTISIELEAAGRENALGFSLMFDPAQFRFSSAEKGADAQLATLQINQVSASKGRIGIAIALPPERSFNAGTNQVVVLRFALRKPTSEAIAVAFTDLPVARELAAVDASSLNVTFDGGAASGANPIDSAQYFVYRHYLDILGRQPDAGGLDYWTDQIASCGSDRLCVQTRRVAVSNAFFFEQEFQDTGAYVYRVYKSALGIRPTYAQFMTDRSQVIGGLRLDHSKTEFTNYFVQRPAFSMRYPLTMTPEQYVEALSANTGNSLTQAQQDGLVTGLANGTDTRGTVLRKVAENRAFSEREYNGSFVLMQYFGFLRRDPDLGGFDFWLGQMNRFPLRGFGTQRALVCSFITSAEYQLRFGSVVSHTDAECVP